MLNQTKRPAIAFETGTINAGKFQLRYRVEGTGIPTLVIGSTIYYPPTFSQQLRKHLRLIFLDQRGWVVSPGIVDDVQAEFGLDVLIDDVERARKTLGLERIVILGHSGHSYMALEYAKKYPQHVSHVVMIGISPDLSAASKAAAEQYWQDAASPERKAAMARNIKQLSDEQLAKLSPSQRFTQEYLRNTPRIWYDFDFSAAEKLWEGCEFNMQMFDYVWGTIFRDIDVTKGLEQLDKPVFLALGRCDFLIGPPSAWQPLCSKFKDLTIHIFEKSGHTPQLEEPELFDKELLQWLKK